MALKRVILEMGTGNDLHGGDYTKAAVRAVNDAIHHSSLTMIRTLKVDPRSMQVDVTIGVQAPEQVDVERVQAALPHGTVRVHVVDATTGKLLHRATTKENDAGATPPPELDFFRM